MSKELGFMREKTILLVEDNEDILEANRRVLQRAGYSVNVAQSIAAARESLHQRLPDAIVLDIMLPDGNGLDFIEEIRMATTAPVLLLTSLTQKDDRLIGLRAGGDDYITKPYDLDELVERIEAFLRREEMYALRPGANVISVGSLTLDNVANQAYICGKNMGLSMKEFAILLVLVQNKGRAVSKETLYEVVWKQPVITDTRTVWTHVSILKKKLSEDGGRAFNIYTERGVGYRFEHII